MLRGGNGEALPKEFKLFTHFFSCTGLGGRGQLALYLRRHRYWRIGCEASIPSASGCPTTS